MWLIVDQHSILVMLHCLLEIGTLPQMQIMSINKQMVLFGTFCENLKLFDNNKWELWEHINTTVITIIHIGHEMSRITNKKTIAYCILLSQQEGI